MSQPANDNPKTLSGDELLYRAVEQVCMVANMAKTLSEIHQVPMSENGKKLSADALAELHRCTRALDTNAILSRFSVNIAAAAQSKHIIGATLTISKASKQMILKGHYGPGPNDYHDLLMSHEVCEQLRDALTKGLSHLPKLPTVAAATKTVQ